MTVLVTDYVSISDAVCVMNTRDGAYFTYYTGNFRFNYLTVGLLLRLHSKTLEVPRCSVQYQFSLPIWTDPVLTALAGRRYMEVVSDQNATQDGFVRYDSTKREVL